MCLADEQRKMNRWGPPEFWRVLAPVSGQENQKVHPSLPSYEKWGTARRLSGSENRAAHRARRPSTFAAVEGGLRGYPGQDCQSNWL